MSEEEKEKPEEAKPEEAKPEEAKPEEAKAEEKAKVETPPLSTSESSSKSESKSLSTSSSSSISFDSLLSLLDLESRPSSRAGWFLRIAVLLVATVMLAKGAQGVVGPMLRTKPPPPLPSEELAGDKFRLSEAERKEIFREFATAEIAERARGISQNTWNGHAWSREDDRGYIERTTARAAAARHHCSLSQVYLVLDEGIRAKWPGPDGKPLAGTTPPHNPRTTW